MNLIRPTSTVLEAVLDSADRNASRSALCVDDRFLTYDELRHVARSIAAAIVESGAPSMSRQCAVFAHRSATAYAALLGAQMAGMAYVPLSPKFPAARTQRMLERSEASVVVIDATCTPHAGRVLANIERPMIAILPEVDTKPPWAESQPQHRFILKRQVRSALHGVLHNIPVHEIAYLLFTSGSTGQPKGVAIRQSSVADYARSAAARLCVTAEDKFTQLPDLTFDLSVHDLYACWCSGACLYTVPDTALLAPDDFVRKHELTMWCSVPSAVARLKQYNRLKPCSLPTICGSMFCGEALPTASAEDWLAAAPNTVLENFYGPTEATCAITAFRYTHSLCDRLGIPIVPVGIPFEGQETVILDSELRPVPAGESGELCLGGSQLSPGYWKDPEMTRERYLEIGFPGCRSTRWYRTGDLASWRDGIGLLYHGRSDDQVKIAGFRVELQEIESAVRNKTGASFVAVIPWPLGRDGGAQGVVAFVAQLGISPRDVIQHCSEQLPTYMVPKEVISLPELPLNANGKIDRKRLQLIRSEMAKNQAESPVE